MATSLNSTCRLVPLHIHNISKCFPRPVCCSRRHQQAPAVTERKEHDDNVGKIIIPRRKKRDSLSLLKALSSTVGQDFTAAHNRYIDDQFLIPASFKEKQLYSLSRSSGRKAARYFVDNFPSLFEHSDAEPKIQAYHPPKEAYEHPDSTEEALLERIELRRVKDAIAVYKNIRQTGEKLPLDTQLKLLELLAIYNCEDPPPPVQPEELLYTPPKGRTSKTWHNKGVVEELFEDLPEKTSDAYNSMVRSMAKHLDTKGAFLLYEEMTAKGIPVSRETYHALIPLVPYYTKEKWELLEKLLNGMKGHSHEPNLKTFNAILLSLSRMTTSPDAKKNTMKTLVEMRNCGIEPCLGTWYHLIRIFYFFEDDNPPVLQQVMSEIEGKQFSMQDPNDLLFFSFAMMKCCVNLRDLELAYKIDALLHTGNNIMFIGSSFGEQSYCWHFFQLLCMFETMDKIMEYYEKVVPNFWVPAVSGLKELLDAVQLHEGYEYIPRIWSDVVLLDYFRNASFTTPFFKVIAKKKHSDELQSQLAEIAKFLIDRWNQERKETYSRPVEMSGETIGDIILITLRADRFEEAWSAFQAYKLHNRMFSGLPSEDSLVALTDICIQQDQAEHAIECLSLVSNLSFTCTKKLAESIKANMELTDSQKQHIDVLM